MTEVLIERTKTPEVAPSGVFRFRFGEGGLIPRLATFYSSPFNHLQM